MLKRKMEDKIRLFMEGNKVRHFFDYQGARQTGKGHILSDGMQRDMGKNLVEINFWKTKSAVSLMDAAS